MVVVTQKQRRVRIVFLVFVAGFGKKGFCFLRLTLVKFYGLPWQRRKGDRNARETNSAPGASLLGVVF
jgi:hypothetical protein